MALFGGHRDISLFRTLSRELINEIIDIEVDIFKSAVYDSDANLYGEAINKVYKPGVRVACLIETEDQEWGNNSVVENQFIVGKNPETDKGFTSGERAEFGRSFSIICTGHQTRKSRVQLDDIRAGYKYGLYNE